MFKCLSFVSYFRNRFVFELYIIFVFAIRKEAGDFIANKLFSVPDSVSPIGSVVQKHRRAPFYKKTPVAAASVGMFFSQVVSWYSQWCTW